MGLNLYRGFDSLRLRQNVKKPLIFKGFFLGGAVTHSSIHVPFLLVRSGWRIGSAGRELDADNAYRAFLRWLKIVTSFHSKLSPCWQPTSALGRKLVVLANSLRVALCALCA